MNDFIKHVVIDMDDSRVQRCVICGEVICDYRNSMSCDGSISKGFGSGSVYISKSKNPTVFKTDHWSPPTEYDTCH